MICLAWQMWRSPGWEVQKGHLRSASCSTSLKRMMYANMWIHTGEHSQPSLVWIPHDRNLILFAPLVKMYSFIPLQVFRTRMFGYKLIIIIVVVIKRMFNDDSCILHSNACLMLIHVCLWISINAYICFLLALWTCLYILLVLPVHFCIHLSIWILCGIICVKFCIYYFVYLCTRCPMCFRLLSNNPVHSSHCQWQGRNAARRPRYRGLWRLWHCRGSVLGLLRRRKGLPKLRRKLQSIRSCLLPVWKSSVNGGVRAWPRGDLASLLLQSPQLLLEGRAYDWGVEVWLTLLHSDPS